MVFFTIVPPWENKLCKDEHCTQIFIFIPSSTHFHTSVFFKACNQMIPSFIWNNMSAHIRKAFMGGPKILLGLLLPNLHSYYWAANLNALSLWLKNWNGTAPA